MPLWKRIEGNETHQRLPGDGVGDFEDIRFLQALTILPSASAGIW